ncbi:hypothetical protein L6V77_18845 [Myxococcota bacterium]|nr:hypothetical protein [Myxococcota bacterium]
MRTRWTSVAVAGLLLAACGGGGGSGGGSGGGGSNVFDVDAEAPAGGGSGGGGSTGGANGGASGGESTGGSSGGSAGGSVGGSTGGANGGGGSVGGGLAPDAGPGCTCPGAQTCDASGACVEPDVCAGHEDCLDPRVCVEGACRDMCRGDGDCPDGTHCDLGTQACVEGGPCRDDAACGEGRRCEAGACVATCVAEPCPGAQVCELATGLCTEPAVCSADVDCLEGRVCRDQICLTPCVENAMCPGAQTCVDGRCNEPPVCRADVDCQAGRVCSGGVCQAHCGGAGCPGDQACDASGVCLEASPCDADDGCFAGRRCVGGACESPCVEAADCPGALVCDAGACVEGPGCFSDEGCLPGRRCDAGRCVDRCDVAGCPGALRCDGATGLCEEDAPCRDDAGCLPGRFCVGGACTAGCVEAAQCPGAMDCVDGRCAEPAFCRGPLDCHPGRICTPEGLCRDGCDAARPCAGTLRCEAGLCVEGDDCAADRDCLEGRVCNQRLAICAASCAGGAPCPAGEFCSLEGYCQAPFCGADADCPAGQGCLRGTCRVIECHLSVECAGGGVCVDGDCAADAPGACACPAGWACETTVCTQPGRCAAGVCPAGWVCGAEGTCGLCDADADCGAGRACVAGFCAEPAGCALDVDCLPGRVCGPFGTCEGAACVDDDLAPNHAPDFAVALDAAVHTRRMACAGRDDWYLVGDDMGLRATARFAADRRPLVLAIYPIGGGFGVPVDENTGVPGESFVTAPAGRYLLRVSAPPGAEGPYSLELTGGLACVDDAFERPWRNDAPALPSRLGLGRFDATLCGADVDHYVVPVAGRLRLSHEGAGRATVDGAALPRTVDGPALVTVEGGPGAGAGGGAYALTIESDPAPADACAAAANAPLGADFDATLAGDARDDFDAACHQAGGRERVFRVRVPSAGRLSVRLLDSTPAAAVLVYRDCADAPLTCSGPMGDVSLDVVAGDYFVAVEGDYAGRARIDHRPNPAACERPTVLEANGPVDVVPEGNVPPFEGACLAADAGARLYAFSLATRSQVSLLLTGGGADALLGLRSTCGSAEAQACSPGDGASLDEVLPAGTYFVTVQGQGPMRLNLLVSPPPAGFSDACDAPAALLSTGDVLTLEGDTRGRMDDVAGLCGAGFGTSDQIWRFRLNARAEVSVRVETDGFNARFYLVDGLCVAERACPAAADLSVRATLEPGEYALVVDAGDLGQSGSFRAFVTAN